MINFNTKNQPFREVMGNGLKYTVPRFQRDYSWGEEQWEDLWQDLYGENSPKGEPNGENSPNSEPAKGESAPQSPPAHYMGYLVLQSSDGKNFTVIDGQQRLTTVSIVILSALYELKKLIENKIQPEDNQKRMEALRNSFIGFTDPVSLI